MKVDIHTTFKTITTDYCRKSLKTNNFTKALKQIEVLITSFCIEYEKSNRPSTWLVLGRELMQASIVVLLNAFGMNSIFTHIENQKKITEIEEISHLNPLINCVRTQGNEQVHESLSKPCSSLHATGILILLSSIIGEFCELIIKTDQKEYNQVECLFDEKENEINCKRIKIGIIPMVSLSHSKDGICMEVFWGAKCRFDSAINGCSRVHSTENMVYSDYFGVGKKLCKRDGSCNKNKTRKLTKTGVLYSLCGDLHTGDDVCNEYKKIMSDRWKLYSNGKISYDCLHKFK